MSDQSQSSTEPGLIQRLIANVPVAVPVFLAMFVGLAAGIYLFPVPPYDNVGPSFTVTFVTIVVAAFGTVGVKNRYAVE